MERYRQFGLIPLLLCVGLLLGCARDLSAQNAGVSLTFAAMKQVDLALGADVGAKQRVELKVGLRDRTYLLSIPEGYSEAQKWPVIVAFHGWRGSAEKMHNETKLHQAAALVVYAEGINQAWGTAPYAETLLDEDVEYVTAILDSLSKKYSVDHQRISAVGFSNGGGMVAALVCQLPNTIRSVAMVAGAFYEETYGDCHGVATDVLVIHGTNDRVIRYYGGERHQSRYYSIDTVMDTAARSNSCAYPITIERDIPEAIRMKWPACQRRTEHIRIGGGGHSWPGGMSSLGKLPENYATYRILQFFGIAWSKNS